MVEINLIDLSKSDIEIELILDNHSCYKVITQKINPDIKDVRVITNYDNPDDYLKMLFVYRHLKKAGITGFIWVFKSTNLLDSPYIPSVYGDKNPSIIPDTAWADLFVSSFSLTEGVILPPTVSITISSVFKKSKQLSFESLVNTLGDNYYVLCLRSDDFKVTKFNKSYQNRQYCIVPVNTTYVSVEKTVDPHHPRVIVNYNNITDVDEITQKMIKSFRINNEETKLVFISWNMTESFKQKLIDLGVSEVLAVNYTGNNVKNDVILHDYNLVY